MPSSPLLPATEPSPLLCPVCGDRDRRTFGPIRYGSNALVADQNASDLVKRVGRVDLVGCPSCGLRWTDPRISMGAVLDLYRENREAHWEAEGRNWSDYVTALTPFLGGTGEALDVGCYTGEFLSRLSGEWRTHGIEPIPYAAQVASGRGIRVHPGTIDDAEFPPESFDLITLWDVIEHLPDPVAAMERVSSWLKPGGIVALETGNAACPFARRMAADWWYVALIEHCMFHTPESISRLFQSFGLTEVHVERRRHHAMGRASTAVQLAKAALYRAVSLAEMRGDAWGRISFVRRILDKHAPCVLLDDHLLVIARKG